MPATGIRIYIARTANKTQTHPHPHTPKSTGLAGGFFGLCKLEIKG